MRGGFSLMEGGCVVTGMDLHNERERDGGAFS